MIEVHFRGSRKKLQTSPEEVKQTLAKMIKLAFIQFSNRPSPEE
jgi:hypothetical protein